MKHRIIELCKDMLIAVLVIAILALTVLALPTETLTASPFLSKLLTPFAGFLGIDQAELVYTETAVPALDAAQPLAISIRNSAGRYSCQYDFAALDSAYESFGATLAQALETAAEATDTTLTRLYTAAQGPSALLWYPTQLPSDVLASWLGVDAGHQGEQAEIFLLAAQEGEKTLRLYLYGQTCRVLNTQVPAESFVQLLDTYRPDGSFFAFEDATGTYQGAAPLSLIPAATPQVLSATSVSPCDSRFVTALVTELGFNPYGDSNYTDSQGNAFFSEPGCSLRISADGTLLYESSEDPRFSASAPTSQAYIEASRSLLERMTQGASGEARLYLSHFQLTEEGAVCEFSYVLGGVTVMQSQAAPAARVHFTGTTVTALSLRIRTYTRGTEAISIMPAAQAAAIVPEGTNLRISYEDTGEHLTAGWKTE